MKRIPIQQYLEEQKKTLLVVHAYRTLQGKGRSEFLKIFQKQKKILADLKTVQKILVDAGSLAYALDAVRVRIQKANAILNRLAINDQYRQLIGTSLFKLFQPSQTVAQAWNIHPNN